MEMELAVALPKAAMQIKSDVVGLEIIQVVDDQTNIAATENLKLVKQQVKAFEEACEPERIRLRTPLDVFLGLKKEAKDRIDEWVNQQTRSIGAYAQEVIRKENERRQAEQKKRDEEEKARIDKQNAENAAFAAMDNSEAIKEEFVPAQEPIQIGKAVVKSEFATASVKEKPNASVTNLILFMQTLIENGKDDWARLIFDKVNQSQLNKFCVAQGINGRDKRFPGIAVEMIAEVKVR